MKVILECEAPESCWECVAFKQTEYDGVFCNALDVKLSVPAALTECLPNCPLIPLEDRLLKLTIEEYQRQLSEFRREEHRRIMGNESHS